MEEKKKSEMRIHCPQTEQDVEREMDKIIEENIEAFRELAK